MSVRRPIANDFSSGLIIFEDITLEFAQMADNILDIYIFFNILDINMNELEEIVVPVG